MNHLIETAWTWIERSAVVEYIIIGAIALAHLKLLRIFERALHPHKRKHSAPRKRSPRARRRP